MTSRLPGRVLHVAAQRQALLVAHQGATVVTHLPDLEEVTERLEWAYHHRRELEMIAERGARDVSQQTWRRTAERFGAILGVPGASGSTSAPSA